MIAAGKLVPAGEAATLSGASVRLQLQKLREKETISDRRDSQEEISRTTSPDHRDLPLRSDRERTQYSDRDRTYSLRPSEIHTLTDVGKFRVVAVEDLANLGYAGRPLRNGAAISATSCGKASCRDVARVPSRKNLSTSSLSPNRDNGFYDVKVWCRRSRRSTPVS